MTRATRGKTLTSLFCFSFILREKVDYLYECHASLGFSFSRVCAWTSKVYIPPSWLRDLSRTTFFLVIFIFFSFHHFFGLLPIFYRVRVCVSINISLSFLPSRSSSCESSVIYGRQLSASHSLTTRVGRRIFFFFLFIFISPNFFLPPLLSLPSTDFEISF